MVKLVGGKDYYDNAGQFGIDPAHIFVRHKNKILPAKEVNGQDTLPSRPLFKYYEWFSRGRGTHKYSPNEDFHFENFTIFFCGKYYNGVRVSKFGEENYRFFYDKEAFKEFMTAQGFEFREKTYNRWRQRPVETNIDYYQEKLIENDITIAIGIEPDRKDLLNYMVDGFNLHDFQFQKVFPPFEAHQEIQMWISSSLNQNSSNMVQITDQVVKRDKHGFDKFSFKKLKEQ